MSKTPTALKKTTARPRRVGLISLGCAKNLVDAEIMLEQMRLDIMTQMDR